MTPWFQIKIHTWFLIILNEQIEIRAISFCSGSVVYVGVGQQDHDTPVKQLVPSNGTMESEEHWNIGRGYISYCLDVF